MRKTIYIAGPMFSVGEREFNETVDRYLRGLGHDTFLPQRDGEEMSLLMQSGMTSVNAAKRVFDFDVNKIKKSDIVVFILDGRVPDDGACVEVGMAYSLGKECIGLKTDPRAPMHGLDNPMLLGVLRFRVANTFEELRHLIDEAQVVQVDNLLLAE